MTIKQKNAIKKQLLSYLDHEYDDLSTICTLIKATELTNTSNNFPLFCYAMGIITPHFDVVLNDILNLNIKPDNRSILKIKCEVCEKWVDKLLKKA